MNIIEERNKRNINRRLKKKQYDELMQLSVHDGEWYPLLSEGMVTYGDGSPWFYIMRGTLRSFYENLEDDYEGSINIGHTDMASFPERIVGKWTKSDLRLVDAGDGREALETRLPINMEHPLVQALAQSEFDLGLSVEMTTDVNYDLTNDRENNPFAVPMVQGVTIWDFAIVGDAGDVNSMGIHLKGGTELQMNKLAELLNKEGGSNIADITKLMDTALSEAEEEQTAEEEEAAEEEVDEEETPEEETEELSAEEEPAEEEEEEENNAFMSVLQQLTEEVASLRTENAALRERLAAKETAEAEFVKKFKKLTVSLPGNPKAQAKEHKVDYTDGIGE